MASVSVVSSTDFRANLTQQQNSAPEGDDPFSLLLNSVADVKATVERPEAPQVAERRTDAPAKQPKPEADADRQTKRQAKDNAKPEAKTQSETAAPMKATETEEDTSDTETDSDDAASAEALLALTLTVAQEQPAVPQLAVDADIAAQAEAAPVVATNTEASAEIPTVPAIAAAAALNVQAEPAQAVQTAPAVKPQFAIEPAALQIEAEAEVATPKISAETISSLLKPVKNASAEVQAQAQTQTQPGSVNVATATQLQGASQLETLHAAINKHMQLALGLEANETQPDAQKPLIASNAVAPNFAVTAQVNAPVQVQTQQVAEAARAVPLDQLAVEIATRAGKGERRFDIRLDPPELGRIDVRLEIDSKGNTTTKLIVERTETLDMLKQDARGLEKALQNAGLKTDAGGLEFSLRQDAQTQQGHQNHAPEFRGRPELVAADTEIMTEIAVGNASLAAQLRGGVDIRI